MNEKDRYNLKENWAKTMPANSESELAQKKAKRYRCDFSAAVRLPCHNKH